MVWGSFAVSAGSFVVLYSLLSLGCIKQYQLFQIVALFSVIYQQPENTFLCELCSKGSRFGFSFECEVFREWGLWTNHGNECRPI